MFFCFPFQIYFVPLRNFPSSSLLFIFDNFYSIFGTLILTPTNFFYLPCDIRITTSSTPLFSCLLPYSLNFISLSSSLTLISFHLLQPSNHTLSLSSSFPLDLLPPSFVTQYSTHSEKMSCEDQAGG